MCATDSCRHPLSDLLLSFTVPGNPIPKARPRHGKGRSFTPKETVLAEQHVRETFRAEFPLWEPSIEDLRFEADFYRETGHHCDTDNLLKLCTDALNAVAYVDDTQISHIRGRRIYRAGAKARTEIRIFIAGDVA